MDHTLCLGKRETTSSFTVNIDGYKQPSAGQQFLGGLVNGTLGIGTLLLTGAVSGNRTTGGGGGGGTTQAPAEQPQLSDADKEVLSICAQYDLAGMDTEIQKMETRLNEINTEFAKQNNYLDLTKNKEYLENEANIKDFEEKYAFGGSEVKNDSSTEQQKGNAYQKIMQQIDNLESQQTVRNTRINTLETNWGKNFDGTGINNNQITKLGNEITALETEISQKYSNPADEQEKNEKYLKEQELDTKRKDKLELENLKIKEQAEYKRLVTEREEAKKAIEQLENNTDYTEAPDDIKNAYTTYQSYLTKRTTLEGMKAGAENKQAQLNSEAAELNTKIMLFKNAKTMESKLTKAQSTFKTNVSNAGAKYTTADQKDGNWWKRNMPKWLGGSSKIERTSMKEAHKDKKAAGETLGSYGVDASDYSISNQAKQKTTELYNSITYKDNFSRKKAIKYFEKKPTATIAEAKKDLELS